MLNRQALLELGEYRNPDRSVLSLYLPIDRSVPEEKFQIHLKNLKSEVEEHKEDYPVEQWRRIRADLERAEEWVRENYARGGQSVAIFADGDALWRPLSIPFPIPAMVALSDRPRLRPLYRLLQRFDRYLAILTDARDSRLFLVTPEESREIAQVEDDTPGRHDQGGWAQARLQRHQDKMVEEHLTNAADLAFDLFQERGYDGVILLGTEERTSHLAELLHPYVQQRVLARLPMEMEAGAHEIGERTLEVARKKRRSRQSEQISEWEDRLKGGNQAVAGFDDTIRAAQQGQLMRLILREDLQAEGGRCQQCGALTVASNGACDYCGGQIRPLRDLTERLAATAMSQGAELIFVPTDGEANRMDPYGGIGALLRYPVT